MSTVPKTVSELYPSKWLRADDLEGPVRVTIEGVEIEEIRGVREPEQKAVVAFKGAHKRMIANMTQCRAIAEIAGSEAFADWAGVKVRLVPAKASNGKGTIRVERSGE